MWESGIILVFWGNNEALTAADCTNPSERSRYSYKAVSNFQLSHCYSNIAYFETAKLNENKAIWG